MRVEKITDAKGIIRTGLKIFFSADMSSGQDSMMVAEVVAVSPAGFATSIPVKDGYYRPLSIGTPIEGYFFSGTGQYFFASTIKNRIFLEDQPVLVIEIPDMFLRTERREFYRVDTFFPVKIIVTGLKGEGDLLHVESNEYSASCVDISGGGMGIDVRSSQIIPIIQNQEVEIDFCGAIPGLSKCKGIAVRKPNGCELGWGIKFIKMSDSDRDKVIRYIFKKQFSDKVQFDKSKQA